jgi:hypothetical protein
MNSIIDLTPQQLRHAANLKEKMALLQKELGRILSVSTAAQHDAAPKKKRKLSSAARAKIAAAQKARWAKVHGKTAAKSAAQPRRKMSATARKRLSRLAKARWAKAHAAGRTRL